MESEKIIEIKKWLENKITRPIDFTKPYENTLDLINELESENDDYYERATILRRENEQLKTLVSSLENQITECKDRIVELEKEKAEQLRQVGERLKEKVIRPCDLYDCVTVDDIDETLKE